MFASMRNKKKTRDSPIVEGAAKTDQQQQQPGRKKDAMPEALKLPSPLRYYPGTQMPMDGWFHACRLCRCWTAFSATATTGEVVPLCRRCLPSAARKGVNPAPKVGARAAQATSRSTAQGMAAAGATTGQPKTGSKAAMPAPTSQKTLGKSSDAQKSAHTWSNSYANIHQHQQQQQQQLLQQHAQQQRYQQQPQPPQPGQARSTLLYKGGSRVFRPASSGGSTSSSTSSSSGTDSIIAPAQAAAAAAAATAALAPPAAAPAAASHHSSSRPASHSERRSSSGENQYVPCYKHLGPTNMHPSSAPADHYITCLGSGSTDTSSGQQSGADMLGAITSLLSDLYKMGFNTSSSSASGSSQEVTSRSNSASKKAAAAAATDSLRNLPI